jgi:hypothetical protein
MLRHGTPLGTTGKPPLSTAWKPSTTAVFLSFGIAERHLLWQKNNGGHAKFVSAVIPAS